MTDPTAPTISVPVDVLEDLLGAWSHATCAPLPGADAELIAKGDDAYDRLNDLVEEALS